MRSYGLLAIGLLTAAGCTTTSPFATTDQKPVPLGTQLATGSSGVPGRTTTNLPSPSGEVAGNQFTPAGLNSFQQEPAQPANPLLAGLRTTTAKIGQALTIEPKVIPDTDSTHLANQPKNIGADLHFQAAQVYESQQNFPGAILHFQKALEQSPGDPKFLVAFGRLYDRRGDFQNALSFYQQALQSDPNNCGALNAMGICYAKQGDFDSALAHLSHASQLQPQNARYKNNMANVLADAGRVDEAYAQLVSVHGEAGAHYNLGYMLLQQGKPAEARRELDLALQANPYMEQARSLLNSVELTPAPTGAANVGFAPPTLGQYSVSQPVNSRSANPVANPAATSPLSAAEPFRWKSAAGPQGLPPL